ncbi:MAG: PIN domain-containing protein [Chloroflexi bacterium]|nr:PIN domain-containing protein [Anaerolineaceae bacterium]MCY4105927.1 PIN domain-containing protein [Chloroflexota bacterium]
MILKPTNSYLLDTTVFIDSYRRRPIGRQILLQSLEPKYNVSYSFITFLELGVQERRNWVESDLFRSLRNFLMHGLKPKILDLADHYQDALLAANRARKRRLSLPGMGDCIIAATAYTNQLCVITRNRRHFGQFRDVPDYAIEVELYEP